MSENSCRLSVKVVPGASRDAVAGEHGDAIRVKLRAPPVDGRANAALVSFLAACLRVPPNTLHLVAGETSRRKIVSVGGLTLAEARQRLLSVS